jgi:hypothetical protein
VNAVGLLTVPEGAVVLVTVIAPLVAVAGTVACSSVEDTSLTFVAATPLNFTVELALNPAPSIVTTVPDGPLPGLKPVIESVGVNVWLLVDVPWESLTEIAAGTAPLGTIATSVVPEVTVTEGETRVPKVTVTAAKPDPVIVTLLPVIPDPGVNELIVGAP